MLGASGLIDAFPDVASALSHLGYVQIDPLNICGRMHDLILRNRVAGYREGDLVRHLHGADTPLTAQQRVAFEHHHPDTNVLVAFPLEAWTHLLGAMEARARRTSAWSGRLTPRERELVPHLLEEIGRRGPLSSEDFVDERRAHRPVWGAASLVKSAFQKLFFHGRLLIAQRSNNRRRYDLPERVLPAEILARPKSPESETARWMAVLKLQQRRLVSLKRDELREVEDAVQPVSVEGCPPLFCLRKDIPLLEQSMEPQESITAMRLLAPLDPVIYDRRLTARLWCFDYTWEAYTPAAKRVRGHYALPVLAGMELIGHVEPKADRAAGRLRMASRSIRRGHSTKEAVADLATWLGLRV